MEWVRIRDLFFYIIFLNSSVLKMFLSMAFDGILVASVADVQGEVWEEFGTCLRFFLRVKSGVLLFGFTEPLRVR